MKSLLEVVTEPAKRREVVEATERLIDAEVSNAGGITGMAIKGGYKVVKKLKDGRMIPAVIDGMLDEFIGAIEPLHAEYRGSGSTSGFGAFLSARGAAASNALLGITDRRAQRTDNAVLRKTYEKLRPYGEKYVVAALPGVGAMIDRFCA
jgi:hypothetical protein